MFRPGVTIITACLVLAACGGGSEPPEAPGVSTDTQSCDGSCVTANSFLTVADVQDVIARAVAEAQARNAPATIAVVDRVGNVLGVFAMNGAPATITVQSRPGVDGGLEGVNIVPSTLAAIAKAVTGAYLSSEGNAFSTRTASQIVQEHFNPGEALAASGPLSGVQFSQLPCSDLNLRFAGGAPDAGPKRSPLGLSADPGGFPLYKGGTPVGAVGVLADGVYTLDTVILDKDADVDEAIALAATFGRAAPEDRRAHRITVDGKTLRFSDAELERSAGLDEHAADVRFDQWHGGRRGERDRILRTAPSSTAPRSGNRPPAFGRMRWTIRASTHSCWSMPRMSSGSVRAPARRRAARSRLTEVREILASALAHGESRARRRSAGRSTSPARVTISVVDSNGVILGIARTRDAPMFGIDVSLQKARTAAFFSNAQAAAQLTALPDAVYLARRSHRSCATSRSAQYVTDLRTFTGLPAALSDGQAAIHVAHDRQSGACCVIRMASTATRRAARQADERMERVLHRHSARSRLQRHRASRGLRARRRCRMCPRTAPACHGCRFGGFTVAGADSAALANGIADFPGLGAHLSRSHARRRGGCVR